MEEGLDVKWLDSGFGHVLTRLARHLGGTLVLRAPQLLQSTVVGPHTSADIFSFGRLLFKLVTETRPLQGWQPREIIAATRCQVALMMHWPVVSLADGVRTLSSKSAHT